MNDDDARNSESAETVSTLVHKILLAQAELVDIEAAARSGGARSREGGGHADAARHFARRNAPAAANARRRTASENVTKLSIHTKKKK